jgi:uncharacterized protein (TIGR02001 family)
MPVKNNHSLTLKRNEPMLTNNGTGRVSFDGPPMKEETMKRSHSRWMSVALGSLLSLLPLAAAAADVTLQADVLSAYVWRGQVYNDEPVVQPSLTAETDFGLSFNVWGNYNTTDRFSPETDKEFSEVDFNVAYSRTVSFLTLGIGYYEYLYMHQVGFDEAQSNVVPVAGTREVYASVGLEDVILAPTLTVYYDFDEVDGFYGNIGISHSLDLTTELELDLSASVGAADAEYNQVYFGVDEDALNDGNVKLGLCYTLTPSFKVSGYVQYTKLLDSDIEDAADAEDSGFYNDGDIISGGASVAYSF